jgi:hypothetical protein
MSHLIRIFTQPLERRSLLSAWLHVDEVAYSAIVVPVNIGYAAGTVCCCDSCASGMS